MVMTRYCQNMEDARLALAGMGENCELLLSCQVDKHPSLHPYCDFLSIHPYIQAVTFYPPSYDRTVGIIFIIKIFSRQQKRAADLITIAIFMTITLVLGAVL